MSLTLFKFMQRLGTPSPVNSPISSGDRVDEALNKLQGQVSAAGAPATGVATVDFGSSPTDEVVLTVACVSVAAASVINLQPSPYGDGTADHSADEHAIEEFQLRAQNIVIGVSFDIRMTCLDRFGLMGQWSIRWSVQG